MSPALPKVFLQKGKERFVTENRHPWIFSGAIASFPEGFESGRCAELCDARGNFLAVAYFHTENSLSGRILSFERKSPKIILREKIQEAFSFRRKWFDPSITDCFRCVNAEEDGLPGLIIDLYGDVAVIQISTFGMEHLRSEIVSVLLEDPSIRSIYEKSCSSARTTEGLEPRQGLVHGEPVEEFSVKENGILFSVSIPDGQKTGFFLDQRELRKKTRELASGKKVLNCFSYSGGFSLFALAGSASHVTSVDVCAKATELCKKNTLLNGFSLDNHTIHTGDAFRFLEEEELSSYDLIILDPPAFAKKRQDIEAACNGYRKINERVMSKMKKGGLLITCSCSYFVDEGLFRKTLFQAGSQAKREVSILQNHPRAIDHPVSLYHPEGEYLKSFLLRVS